MLKEKFASAKSVVFTDYKGLSVTEMNEFRRTMRAASIEYRVVKNTLARLASADTPVSVAKDSFAGPVGLAIGYDDPAIVAKVVLEYAKKNEKVTVTCGVMDGSYYELDQLKTISMLPPREVLLGMLAGTLQAPSSKMARLLSATVAKMGYALGALRDKRQDEGGEQG